jgi:hypothetical protein
MCYGVSHSYQYLSLRSSNSGWHGNWFYIHDDTAAPLPQFCIAAPVRLESWSLGCDRSWLKKVLEILRILKGWMLAGLNGVTILHTMVEWWVQPLKLWAYLLCD